MEVTPKTPSTLITTSVTQVGVSVNGESRKPMQVQFNDDGTGLYILGYEMLFSGMDKMFSDSGNLISREDYGKGYTLYTLDLTRQTLPALEHFNPVQTGNVRLSIQFCSSLAKYSNLPRHIIFDFST